MVRPSARFGRTAWQAGHALVIASIRLDVDDAGPRAETSEGLDDKRESMGEVVAGAAVEPYVVAILSGDDAESVVLNLVQPQAAGRQLIGFGGEARRDEPGSQRTQRHGG